MKRKIFWNDKKNNKRLLPLRGVSYVKKSGIKKNDEMHLDQKHWQMDCSRNLSAFFYESSGVFLNQVPKGKRSFLINYTACVHTV